MWAKDKYTGFSQPLQDIHDDSGFLGTPYLFHSRKCRIGCHFNCCIAGGGGRSVFLKVNQKELNPTLSYISLELSFVRKKVFSKSDLRSSEKLHGVGW
jgi:hypothetical protein